MKLSLFCLFLFSFFSFSSFDGTVRGVNFYLSTLSSVVALSISSIFCCFFSFSSKRDAKYLSLSLILTIAASILSFKTCAIFLTRSTTAINSSLTQPFDLLRDLLRSDLLLQRKIMVKFSLCSL